MLFFLFILNENALIFQGLLDEKISCFTMIIYMPIRIILKTNDNVLTELSSVKLATLI